MDTDCLDFRRLPNQNSLFLAHLYDFERVRSLYQPLPTDAKALRERAESVLSRYAFPRDRLVSRLRDFNQQTGCGEATERHLDRLARPDTVAVVSGQQVGLFGGPAYTLYKAATAVRLAAWLEENGVPAVPVFWLAADDSDFEEVRAASFMTRDAELITIRHPDPRAAKETMAGAAPVDAADMITRLETALEGYPFTAQAIDWLRDSHRPGRTFAEAFAGLLSAVFRDHGLILYDSRDLEIRRLQGSFFAAAVERRDEIVERLLARGEELIDRGFQPQVAVDPSETLLFYIQGDQRYKLKFERGEFQAKERKSLRFSPDALAAEAREKPENFGFNALLRPILQDRVFPTSHYVGGPAEVAYFAQVGAIAPVWGVLPLIQPRAGFTVVDAKSRRLSEKYQLSWERLLTASEGELAEEILHQSEHERVLELLDGLGNSIGEQVEALQRHLREIDPPLVDMIGNAHAKIEYQVGKVRQRFVSNQQSRTPHLKAHLTHLLNRFQPNGQPQERVFCVTQLLAELGSEVVDALCARISPDCSSHRVWRR